MCGARNESGAILNNLNADMCFFQLSCQNKRSDFLLVLVGRLHLFLWMEGPFCELIHFASSIVLQFAYTKRAAVLCSCNVEFMPLGGTRSTLSTKSTVFHTGAAPHVSPRPHTTGEWTEKIFSLRYKHKVMLVTLILMCLHVAAQFYAPRATN